MGKHHKPHILPREEIGGIAIREIRPGYWLVDFQRGGKRVRKAFGDLDKAKEWAEGKKDEILKKGIEVLNLPDRVRAEALEAMRRLEGTGVSILDAVNEYLRRHPKVAGETVRQTCDKYLAAMRAADRRPLSVYEKDLKFRALCAAMGESFTAGLDMAEIEQWAQTREVGKLTTEAYVGAGRDLLAFFRRGGRLKARHHFDEKPPVTWDVQTVTKLMATAEEIAVETVPAFAVLFFAGLRPHEMLRLTWDQVDLATGVIRLTGAETKTRTMRNVEIAPNLRAWLTKYRGIGNVAPAANRYRDLREKVMEGCDLTDWPVDVPRHTFATMHYNAHQDATKTQAQLGHFGGPQVFLTHYKGVPVTAADAAKYWKIRPAKTQAERKVVPFAAAG